MGTLTNGIVRDAKPRAKVYELTCAGLPGFALRVLPTGKKVFVVRHRMHGQDCRVRLGLWSATLTVEEARRRAAVLLGGGELDVPASPHEFDEDEQPRAPTGTPLQPLQPRTSAPQQARRLTNRRAAATTPAPAATTPAPAPATPAPPAPRPVTPAPAPATPAPIEPPWPATPGSMAPPAAPSSAAPPTRAWTPAPPAYAFVAPVRATPLPREPTLGELADRYRSEYVDIYLKPRTASNYRHYLDTYILPALGDRPFTQVTRSAIQSLHASLRAHPAAADYVLCVIGSFYTRIIRDWELVDMRNPVSNTRRFGSRRVERRPAPASPNTRHSPRAPSPCRPSNP